MAIRDHMTVHRLQDWAPESRAGAFVCGLPRYLIDAEGRTMTRIGANRWARVTCKSCLRERPAFGPTAAAGRPRTHYVDPHTGLQACSLVALSTHFQSSDMSDVTCGACKRSIVRRLEAGSEEARHG